MNINNNKQMIANKTVQRRNPANIGTGEDVLKTSFIFVFRRHPQDVFKICWSKTLVKTFSTKLNWPYKHVFKTTSRHLYDIFNTVSRCLLLYIFRGYLLDAFKTSCWRYHIQDLFKMSSKHHSWTIGLVNTSSTNFQDIRKVF